MCSTTIKINDIEKHQRPTITECLPSLLAFGMGTACHLFMIYKKPPVPIQPFGISWGSFTAYILAPRPFGTFTPTPPTPSTPPTPRI